jgi:hypothetical protein
MTQDHSGRGRARLRLVAVVAALPLGASVVGGVAGAVPVAAATRVQAAQPQTADSVTAAQPAMAVRHDDSDHHRGHNDRDRRGDCRHRDEGLLGLLADLLLGPRRCS